MIKNNDKLKRMQIILIIAAFLIVIADISLFYSSLINENVIKVLIGCVIPFILIFLSRKVEVELKLEKIAVIIFDLAMAAVLSTLVGTTSIIVSNVLPNISETLDAKIWFSSVGIFGLILSYVANLFHKDRNHMRIGYIFLLIVVFALCFGFESNNEFISLLLKILPGIAVAIVNLLANLFMPNKDTKFLTGVNAGVALIGLYLGFTSHVLIDLVITLLFLSYLMVNIRRVEEKHYDIASFVVFSFVLVAGIGNMFAEPGGVLISTALVIFVDMLFCVFDIGKDVKEAVAYKIILDLIVIFLMIYSISSGELTEAVLSLVIISSIVSTYALKSDKYEQYLLPIKMVVCIIGLLNIVNNYINLNPIIYYLAVDIASLIGYLLSNDKRFKSIFIFIIFGCILLNIFGDISIFKYVVMDIMLLFDYYVLFIMNKELPKLKVPFFVLACAYANLALIDLQFNIAFLIIGIVELLVYFGKIDKDLEISSWLFSGFSLVLFFNNANFGLDINSCLVHFIIFVFIGRVIYYNFKEDGVSIIFMAIMLCYGIGDSNIYIALAFLAEMIITLFICYKDNEKVYKGGFICLIIDLIYIFGKLDAIPTFVYMLFVGIVVAYFIFKQIKKYILNEESKDKEIEKKENRNKVMLKEDEIVLPPEDNNEFVYCENCGTKLNADAKFCKNCGNKVSK